MRKLSIVIPTIPGREEGLAQVKAAYDELTPLKIEWIIERGHDNCASAWNAGIKKAHGKIVHMGSDDIWPVSEAWWPAALSKLDEGKIPLGYVIERLQDDSEFKFGRDFTRIVICERSWWTPVPEIHYYSDNAFDDLMRASGHLPEAAEGFDFHHGHSMIGRNETRLNADMREYEAWKRDREGLP